MSGSAGLHHSPEQPHPPWKPELGAGRDQASSAGSSGGAPGRTHDIGQNSVEKLVLDTPDPSVLRRPDTESRISATLIQNADADDDGDLVGRHWGGFRQEAPS